MNRIAISVFAALLLAVGTSVAAAEQMKAQGGAPLESTAASAEANGPAAAAGGSTVAEGIVVPPSGYISFDTMTPCFFSQTVPIARKWFSHLGILFKGPNTLDGAAVLNECSDFGVTGHTSPDFLAFNCSLVGQMANGGTPMGPETLVLSAPVVAAQLAIGSGIDAGQTVLITAKSATGKTVDSSLVTLSATMQDVFLMGSAKIKSVIISVPPSSNACAFVVDDIYFGTP